MRRSLLAIMALSIAVAGSAQPAPPPPEPALAYTPELMVWTDGPSTLPPGSKMAVLEGSPRAVGMFTLRVRIPGGSAIPPHWHPRQERVTILSGAVDLGFGSTANAGAVTRYRAGSFYVNPPRVMHYLFFPEATEMQMTGVGPWELETSDISKPGPEATATVTIRSLTPEPGSVVTPSTTIKAVVDYEIHDFRPSTFFLTIAFDGSKPNSTVAFSKEIAKSSTPFTAPTLSFVQSASGTITLTQELDRALASADVKHPLRARIQVQELQSDVRSRIAGQSDWVEFH